MKKFLLASVVIGCSVLFLSACGARMQNRDIDNNGINRLVTKPPSTQSPAPTSTTSATPKGSGTSTTLKSSTDEQDDVELQSDLDKLDSQLNDFDSIMKDAGSDKED